MIFRRNAADNKLKNEKKYHTDTVVFNIRTTLPCL